MKGAVPGSAIKRTNNEGPASTEHWGCGDAIIGEAW